MELAPETGRRQIYYAAIMLNTQRTHLALMSSFYFFSLASKENYFYSASKMGLSDFVTVQNDMRGPRNAQKQRRALEQLLLGPVPTFL